MSDFIQLEYLQEKLQQLLAESLFAIYLMVQLLMVA